MIVGIDARLANEVKRAGVGNYCAELLRALPAAAPDLGLRLYLDAPPRAGFSLDAEVAELRVLPAGRWWTQRILGRELRQHPPDVFFSPVTQLPLRCPCPAVAVVHDLAFVGFPEYFTWRRLLRARLQTRHAHRSAAALVTDSESTRRELEAYYGVAAERITTAPLGCGQQYLARPGAEAVARVRRAHELPERYILYVGRLQPRKNLSRLIEAFERVRARHPEWEWELLIAGDAGWRYGGIHEAAERSPARDAIRFLGFVPEEDLPGLIAGAEVLALVSLWEGFGLPVIEAMACGTAVLTSNTSALPEVAGDAALLVDPHDTEAIAGGFEQLLMDGAFREALVAKGIEQAAKFTWEETARCVAEVIRRVGASS